jgi:hypothetical protein
MEKNTFKTLDEKPHEIELFGIPRHQWEDIIQMNLSKASCEDVRWIEMA